MQVKGKYSTRNFAYKTVISQVELVISNFLLKYK